MSNLNDNHPTQHFCKNTGLIVTDRLELQGIARVFGTVRAVQNITLSIKEGQFLTLLGPSGCGKTTTLRLIAGFDAPDEGAIRIGGRIVADKRTFVPPEERRVGMVFQEYALFPHLSVADNVAFGLKGRHDVKQARVKAMLELVGLPHLSERMPQALSGGQQQRVALARALAPQPEILLLDEPFSNLDAALRLQVRAEVRSILRETGTTAIFVTHDQEEALSLSDKIAVMLNGTIAQFETPQQIYTHPISKAVAQFVGEANFVPAHASGTRASSALGDVTLLNSMLGAVELLVRPEMIHIDPAQEGVSAQILWSEYYGHQQRVGIRLADNTSLIVRTEAQIVYTLGQQVRIRVYAPLWAYRQV